MLQGKYNKNIIQAFSQKTYKNFKNKTKSKIYALPKVTIKH